MPTWLNAPLLHTGSPEPTGWLHSNWRPQPTVVLGVLLLIGLYVYWTGSRNQDTDGRQIYPASTWQRILFVIGALTILVALGPPLDDWSDHFLLSAHMAQHLLLMMLAVPLLIAGTPPWLISRLISRGPARTVMYALTRPIAAFVISNLVIVFWHLPFAYNQILGSLPVHILAHLSFMAAAVLMWWPVMGRSPELPGLSPLVSCLYLFASTIPGGIVGAFITFAGPGLYDVYPDAPRIWGIGVETDQQIAGLTMWVLTGTIYLGWMTVIFLRWASAEERADRNSPSPGPSPAHP
jgi:cytochrome c oxidase assembly factor CtaG